MNTTDLNTTDPTASAQHRSLLRRAGASARRTVALAAMVAAASLVAVVAAPAAGAVPVGSDQEVVDDLAVALSVTRDYWARHHGEVGLVAYTPPSLYGQRGDGIYDSSASQEARGTCGGQPLTVWERNAFSCSDGRGDTIGFDWQLLHDAHQFGDGMVYFLVAHEWGHSVDVQRTGGFSARYEGVADCYAGAAMAGAARDGTLLLDEEDLLEVWAFLDSTRTSPQLPYHPTQNPYGTPEDRWGFFVQGYDSGPVSCTGAGQQQPF